MRCSWPYTPPSGCTWSTARARPISGTADPGVVKQDKSSRGSVDTTEICSDPQRVGMYNGERPIGAAKGQTNTMPSCQPPHPTHSKSYYLANPSNARPRRHWTRETQGWTGMFWRMLSSQGMAREERGQHCRSCATEGGGREPKVDQRFAGNRQQLLVVTRFRRPGLQRLPASNVNLAKHKFALTSVLPDADCTTLSADARCARPPLPMGSVLDCGFCRR